ncbi:MAG: Zn-ribbon domain-containing OB-fold protein [Anaerolineae bacterium]|nr:Zn-ribbon domain-containing OB-fold protein [Anaerolineae bacterium]
MSTSREQQPFTHASFQHFLTEHKLMAARCTNCGALCLPPRPRCPHCQSTALAWTALSRRGRLIAYTVIHIAPTLMLEAGYSRDKPYCSGVVQLEEGPHISGQILGVDVAHPETIAIGAPVQVAFVERGQGDTLKTYLAFEVS